MKEKPDLVKFIKDTGIQPSIQEWQEEVLSKFEDGLSTSTASNELPVLDQDEINAAIEAMNNAPKMKHYDILILDKSFFNILNFDVNTVVVVEGGWFCDVVNNGRPCQLMTKEMAQKLKESI